MTNDATIIYSLVRNQLATIAPTIFAKESESWS